MESEEPMEIDSGLVEKFDDLLEEGEYVETESNRVNRKPISEVVQLPEPIKAKTLVTGIDIFGKETQEKLEERARRFGIKEEKFDIKEAQNLYKSFGIVEGTMNAQDYKLNVINMRGTEKMTTKDVFKYFEDYAPASIEWINDISCNVVWLDKVTAARAILGLSKKITGLRKNSRRKAHSDDETERDSDDDVIINGDDEKESNENTIHVKDIRCPIPPGIWRKGRDYIDTRDIFLRFATVTDRRPHPKEKPALKGILTNSRKRVYKQREPTPPPIVTNGIAAKNPWGSLSKNWGVTDFVEDDYLPKKPVEPASNIKQRLGLPSRRRRDLMDDESAVIELSDDSVETQEDSFDDNEEEEEEELEQEPEQQQDIAEVGELVEEIDEEGQSSSDEDDWCRRSKLPRMRMHADDEEAKIQKRKGKIRNLVNNTARTAGNNFREYEAYEIVDDVDSRRGDNLRSCDLKKESDLRKRLTARRRIPPQAQPKLKPDIQVVLTNPKVLKGQRHFGNIDVTEDEDDEEVVLPPKVVHHPVYDEEEGEIIDDSESDGKVEYEEEQEEESAEEVDEVEEVESDSGTNTDTSDSSIEEKEVQGPKGSVIKVVPRKPKLQSTVSTVWSRLNTTRNNRDDDSSPERSRSKADLRYTLKKTDLRSRIGNNHMRGRSPLRIELRNDKYAGRRSDSD